MLSSLSHVGAHIHQSHVLERRGEPCRASLTSTDVRHSSTFGPRVPGSHPAAFDADPGFAVFKHLNAQRLEEAGRGPGPALVSLECSGSSMAGAQVVGTPSPASMCSLSRVGARHRAGPSTTALFGFENPNPQGTASSPAESSSWGSATSILRRAAFAAAAAGAVDVKEAFEAAEYVGRVRRRVRRSMMLDCACGHGLVGILFAAAERNKVQHVYLIDAKQPPAFDRLLQAIEPVAPWVRQRVTFLEGCDLASFRDKVQIQYHQLQRDQQQHEQEQQQQQQQQQQLHNSRHQMLEEHLKPPPGSTLDRAVAQISARAEQGAVGVMAVHACGALTDVCLDVAVILKAPVAVMPCCYSGTSAGVPQAARRALGVSMAADLHRVYHLTASNCYTSVDFAAIPASITPMNRIIIAERAGGKKTLGNMKEDL